MKVFLAVLAFLVVAFSSGCATYRTDYGKDSGVIRVGSYIWPAPQSEIIVFNNTPYLIELREGNNLEKPDLQPMKSFSLSYNIYLTCGTDLPLTVIIYKIENGMRVNLGTVFKNFYLRNSDGRSFDRYQWVIECRSNQSSFYGYVN